MAWLEGSCLCFKWRNTGVLSIMSPRTDVHWTLVKGKYRDYMLMKNRHIFLTNLWARGRGENKDGEDKDREQQTGLELRAESDKLIRKTISDTEKMKNVHLQWRHKFTSHRTGQARDTDTVLPNVSWATPTKQMEKGVINSHIHI